MVTVFILKSETTQVQAAECPWTWEKRLGSNKGPRAVILNLGAILAPGDTWQRSRRFWFTAGTRAGGGAPGISSGEARDAGQHPALHRMPPPTHTAFNRVDCEALLRVKECVAYSIRLLDTILLIFFYWWVSMGKRFSSSKWFLNLISEAVRLFPYSLFNEVIRTRIQNVTLAGSSDHCRFVNESRNFFLSLSRGSHL